MKKITLILISFILISCGKEEETAASSDDYSTTIESAITALGGASDEQGNQDQAYFERSNTQKVMDFLSPIPSAYAAACSGRAFLAGCNSGVKTVNYDECSLGNSNFTLDGDVSLTYSDAACDFNNPADVVTRTYGLTLQGPFGSLSITSASHQDYRGNTIGGGGRLTNNGGNSYTVDILGKRKVRTTNRGRTFFDVSMRTTESIALTGGLARANRVLDGGKLEIIHNLAEYTAILEPTNLSYTTGCCYPTGGSIDVTYEGSLEGNGTVEFLSCGSAQVTYNGETKPISFYSCE